MGVEEAQIFIDHGLTGANRVAPGSVKRWRRAELATRSWSLSSAGWPAHFSVAKNIADELTAKGVVLRLGGSTHDPTDPVDRLLFNVSGMVAEFEEDLIRMGTREGMAAAKAKGRLKGKQPKLSQTQRKHLLTLHDAASIPRPNWPSCSGCPGQRVPRAPKAHYLMTCAVPTAGKAT
ncbi:recombinase family protein [Pseudarthrobacter sp. NPDC058329]|uniref:recombinase family protein n=1 Tax=Pseudarthrobacter sp. NPDC058329 TaxID=3346448 RepID=UPI0036D8E16B